MAETTEPQEGGQGTDFTPITSQDELNRIVGARVAREKEKYKGFEDYKAKAELYDKAKEAEKTELDKANERASAAESLLAEYKEKERVAAIAAEVAKETGVPADVLRGSTAEEMKAHAESIKKLINPYQSAGSSSQSFGGKPPAGKDWLREAIARH